MKKLLALCMFFALPAFGKNVFVEKNLEFVDSLKKQQIDVIAPASGSKAKTIKDLQKIPGLNLRLPARCISTPASLSHSASDDIRFECLKDAITNKSSNIVWSLRGGYGSAKLISRLSLLAKPDKEKFFIGYSDITALHLFFSQNWGWKTIHGPVLIEFLNDKKDRDNFIKIANIVSGKVSKSIIGGIIPINSLARENGIIEGTLTGGNLTIVQNSIGTPWQIITTGKIIFLEDINIYPYQLDRILLHLKHAGLFDNIKAIIFGELYNCKTETNNVLEDFANTAQVPVYKSMKFGHGVVNDPIIYNAATKIIRISSDNYQLVTKLK
ncbi:MAG: LD-carboxypeptidase [Janthinobacterium lividum]